MCCDEVLQVSISGPARDKIASSAHALDISVREYLLLALNVASQLPNDLLLCLSAGIPVDFRAYALVGDLDSGEVDDG